MDQLKLTSNTSGDTEHLHRDSGDPIDLTKTRENIVRLIDAEAVDMVTAIISGIKDGQFMMAKYLFELAGLHPPVGGTDHEDSDSLAATLLRKLDTLDAESPERLNLK